MQKDGRRTYEASAGNVPQSCANFRREPSGMTALQVKELKARRASAFSCSTRAFRFDPNAQTLSAPPPCTMLMKGGRR